MDASSRDVTSFLAVLQDGMERLRSISVHYMRKGATTEPQFFRLSFRPFGPFVYEEGETPRRYDGLISMGLPIAGPAGAKFKIHIDIGWDDRRWTVVTEGWREVEGGDEDLVSRLPERVSEDLATCLDHVRAAIEDLLSFEDVLTASPPPA